LSVKLARKPKRALLAPDEQDLDFDYRDSCAHVRVTVLDGHATVVFE
jgi:hypothetical protein